MEIPRISEPSGYITFVVNASSTYRSTGDTLVEISRFESIEARSTLNSVPNSRAFTMNSLLRVTL